VCRNAAFPGETEDLPPLQGHNPQEGHSGIGHYF
jgi:hypothetical protein